jgi:UDP:flavonoid glycosyltransferase YjiC (YdhE family)
MANNGFGDDRTLVGLGRAWRNLFKLTRPDLIVFDHSPTALLASRGLPARRALLGDGFVCPPDVSPFPAMLPSSDPPRLDVDERTVLARVNRVLGLWNQPPLVRLGQLYSEVDERFLCTFPELDHYPGRVGARYWGAVNGAGGRPPRWPDGRGKRIYAYLKPFPALPALLEELARRGNPTLLLADGIDPDLLRRFRSPNLRFETERLDLLQACRDCDVAVLNANHGTTSAMLLAGKPVLMLSLHPEQRLLAEAVCRLGAGERVAARAGTAEEVRAKLDALLSDTAGRYARAAEQFAGRHAGFDPARQEREMLHRLGEVLAGRAAPPDVGVAPPDEAQEPRRPVPAGSPMTVEPAAFSGANFNELPSPQSSA